MAHAIIYNEINIKGFAPFFKRHGSVGYLCVKKDGLETKLTKGVYEGNGDE